MGHPSSMHHPKMVSSSFFSLNIGKKNLPAKHQQWEHLSNMDGIQNNPFAKSKLVPERKCNKSYLSKHILVNTV